MVTRVIIRTTIIVLVISLVIVGRGFLYYEGLYQAPSTNIPRYEQIITPTVPSTEFSDTYDESEGIILIDLSHDNAFDIEELNVLILRLISRGLTIEFLNVGDDLERKLMGKVEEPGEDLLSGEDEAGKSDEEPEEELINGEDKTDENGEETEEKPPADAFIIVSPQAEFSNEERETIKKFTGKGGKLLLIADPTRRGKINSLALDSGLIFEADYLYNMHENDANYKNIFINEFKENNITRNLQKITLYTAGSISSNDSGIAFGDNNTFSSLVETRKRLSPIALTLKHDVLAIYDLTFIIEPNNGILDNNRLISNIADWLAIPSEKEKS